MTLRDYFADTALLGLMISGERIGYKGDGEVITRSERAFEIADAMIAEREK